MDNPLISIIMPAYNAANFVAEGIKSLLNQTEQDFELIIIDDGSTDDTLTNIKEIKSSKIRLYESVNRGQAYQLNYGISISKGKYIAIAHADDISLPTRLQKQVAFLINNQHIGVCGSAIKLFDKDSGNVFRYPAEPSLCFQELFFGNPLAHPAIMMNAMILKKSRLRYNKSYGAAEDYDLWIRLCYITKLSNLTETLVHYRIHQNQVSQLKKIEEEELVKLSRMTLIEQLCEPEKKYFLLIFNFVYAQEKLNASEQWKATHLFYQKIILKNLMEIKAAKIFSLNILKRNLFTLPYRFRILHLPFMFKYNKLLTARETVLLFKTLFLKRSA